MVPKTNLVKLSPILLSWLEELLQGHQGVKAQDQSKLRLQASGVQSFIKWLFFCQNCELLTTWLVIKTEIFHFFLLLRLVQCSPISSPALLFERRYFIFWRTLLQIYLLEKHNSSSLD